MYYLDVKNFNIPVKSGDQNKFRYQWAIYIKKIRNVLECDNSNVHT